MSKAVSALKRFQPFGKEPQVFETPVGYVVCYGQRNVVLVRASIKDTKHSLDILSPTQTMLLSKLTKPVCPYFDQFPTTLAKTTMRHASHNYITLGNAIPGEKHIDLVKLLAKYASRYYRERNLSLKNHDDVYIYVSDRYPGTLIAMC